MHSTLEQRTLSNIHSIYSRTPLISGRSFAIIDIFGVLCYNMAMNKLVKAERANRIGLFLCIGIYGLLFAIVVYLAFYAIIFA